MHRLRDVEHGARPEQLLELVREPGELADAAGAVARDEEQRALVGLDELLRHGLLGRRAGEGGPAHLRGTGLRGREGGGAPERWGCRRHDRRHAS